MSDNALSFQVSQLGLVQAQQLAVHIGIVLAQQRGSFAGSGAGAGGMCRDGGDLQLADARLIDGGEHTASPRDLRIHDQTVEGVHRAGRAAGVVQQLVHFINGVLLGPGHDDLAHGHMVCNAVLDLCKAGVGLQLRLAHHIAQDGVELVVAGCDDHVAVLCGERVIRVSGFVTVADALVRDVPAGIIITDENDRITTFNQQAKALVGLQGRKLRGLELGELVPPLSYNTFYKSGQIKTDHIHLLNGTMVRCVQTQLQQGNRQVGMLITMLPDSSRRKKTADTQKFVARHQWKDLVGDSVAITQAMTAGKQLAQTEEHIMILGESGTGKSFFAQCIHQSSPHASEPFVVINATVVGQDASRTLFGSEEGANDHAGLFELAGNGTIVLQGLGGASESFFACLRQVLVYHSFFSVGGTTLKVFQARIITLLEPEEAGRFPRELREMLSVFSLTLPPLRERGDDVIELFRIFAVRGEAGTVSLRGQKELWKELDELLRFYAWPTNLITLSAVVKRYVYLYRQAMNPSPGVKRQLLIKAIGEDELLEQLRQEYPALQDPAGSTPEAVVEGVAEMKRLLKYNDNTIADKLGLGRTTLWRMQKKSGAAKAKKEE